MLIFPTASQPWTRADSLALAAVLSAGIAIRIPKLLFPYVINPDAIDYIRGAQAIATGKILEGLSQTHLSLYPLLIALVRPLSGSWLSAARSVPIAFGILAVVPCYLLARNMLGTRRAWIPALFAGISPAMVALSMDVVREPLFVFFLLGSLWGLVAGLPLAAGLLALLASATRPEGLLLFPLGALFFLVCGLHSGTPARGFGRAAILLLPGMLVAVALAVYLSMTGGSIPDRLSYQRQIRRAISQPASIQERAESLLEQARQYPRIRRFFSMAWEQRGVLLVWSLLDHWVRAAYPAMFLLMVIGFLSRALWRERAWRFLALFMVVWLLMGYVRIAGAFAISKRHLLALALCGYLFSAAGFLLCVDWLSQRIRGLSPRTASIALAGCLVLITAPPSIKAIRQEKLVRRHVGEWIRTLPIPSPLIVTDFPRVAFYADGRATPVEAFFQNPDPAADLLVLRKGPGSRGRMETLTRLARSGWSPKLLETFDGRVDAFEIYALKKDGMEKHE